MLYKFLILSDENENFWREIAINSDASFLDLHHIVLESVGFEDTQLTSFYTCDDEWQKELEITQIEMETTLDVDSYTMEGTMLEQLLEDEGQRLLFEFDLLAQRYLFLELREIQTRKSLDKPEILAAEGMAPKQSIIDDAIQAEGIISPDLQAKIGLVDDFMSDFDAADSFDEDDIDIDMIRNEDELDGGI